ncbi:MAG TPA: uroporphyrinogen-III C-methyltransferase [Usitatibacter sp.]|nr:uroporphyrinogen-III C-methyltransferase [Usitatibacter sp.]
MSEQSPPPLPRTSDAPEAKRLAADRMARTLAVLALAATGAAAWIAIDARMSVRAIEGSVGARLAELGAEAQQAKSGLTQGQAGLREAQIRIAELEARVADTHEQRVALEEMYRELSRSADDRVLSEVEQILVVASQQLQLAGNVRAALAALQAADQRLARAEKLAATPLRRAIAQDMEKLKAVPQVDTAGLALRLDQVINQAETLPLLVSETLPATRVTRVRTTEESGFTRAARDLWDEMKGLVRIRDLATQDAALLAPGQSYFLRENVKLRLLAARMALLARDEAAFREDLRTAQSYISRYFDAKAKPTIAALATLKQVAESPLTIAVPDINASLAAVRTARAAREKR